MLEIFSSSSNSFDNEYTYENVLLLLYRHWFIIALPLVGFLIVLGFAIVGYALIVAHFANPVIRHVAGFLFVLFLLGWWYGLFYRITMYFLDLWIVTDHRVIDSEQHGFFKRTVAELSLAKIQDISVTVSGVIPTFLNYGNLEIQTAGTSEKFFFQQIPNPYHVKDVIMEAHNQYVMAHPDDVEVHEQAASSGV